MIAVEQRDRLPLPGPPRPGWQRFKRRVMAAVRELTQPLLKRLGSTHLGSRLARGTFWILLGTVLSRALGLVSSILVARLLGQLAFGELGIIQVTAGMFGTFAGFGIGVTATKYVAEFRESQRRRCGRMIGLSLAVAAGGGLVAGSCLFLFSPWLATVSLGAPHLAPLLRASAACAIFGSIQGAYLGALAGFEAFKKVAWVNWVSSVLGVGLMVLGAALAGVEGAVWGTVLQSLVGCVLGHAALAGELSRANVRLSFGFRLDEWGVLWRFTLPAFLSAVVATPAGWLSRTLLLKQPGGYAEMAVVSAANQWLNLVTMLPWMMSGVLVPIFASLYSSGRREEFTRLLKYNLLLNGGVALAIALPLMLFAPRILGFYGSEFSDGILIFNLTMAIAIFNAFNGLLSRAMQASGRAWIDMASSIVWAAAMLLSSWLLVDRYKGAGLVAAQALAGSVWAGWQCVLVRNLLFEKGRANPESVQLRT